MEVKDYLSGIALAFSVVSIYYTYKNHKRTIRASKIEEIIDITYFFMLRYYDLYILYRAADNARTSESSRHKELNELYFTCYEETNKYLPKETVEEKISRHYILCNTYLPKGKLKYQILTVNDMFWKMFKYGYERNGIISQITYPNGYPDHIEFNIYIEKVLSKLVKEMNLGYDSLTNNEIIQYRQKYQADLLKIRKDRE